MLNIWKKFRTSKNRLALRLNFSHLRNYFCLSCLTLVCFGSALRAENEPAVDDSRISVKDLMASLPEPKAGNPAGLLIKADNLSHWSELLTPELQKAVNSGSLILDVVRAPNFKFTGSWWNNLALADADLLDEQAHLSTSYRHTEGALFRIPDQMADLEGFDTRKLLWNIQAYWWSARSFSANFQIDLIKEGQPRRTFSGDFSRIYPASLLPEDKTTQLFRERLSFAEPKIISNFAWLSFRFLGTDDDALWMYSPLLKKIRELTSSNRADPLPGSRFALEDLLIWSGQPANLETSIDFIGYKLVPFQSSNASQADQDADGCLLAHSPGNQEAGAQLQVARGQNIYAPRPVYQLVIKSGDSYSVYGRQVLYVDAETFLPYYKVVYDRAGGLLKIVTGIYAASSTADQNMIFYPILTTLDDYKNFERNELYFKNLRVCKQLSPGLTVADFEPSKLLPVEAAQP